MKLTIILILFTISIVNIANCNWFPHIVENFTNKTNTFSSIVKQRGKDIKKFYVDSLRNTLQSFLTTDTNEVQKQTPYKKRYNQKGDETKNNRYDLRKKVESKTIPQKGSIDFAQLDNTNYEVKHHKSREVNPNYENEVEKEKECTSDDSLVYMTTPQLIAYYGYPAESHTVLTEDGYFLTIHRIPFRSRNSTKEDRRRTVLLHHGLLSSSADWVIPGPKKGLAFILSDAGYDVWMANVRGNTYSRYHVSRPVDSYEFWNFTFHEVSQYDLPAVIDYIMEVKGWDVKINYIGHSMGTTVLFALLSTKTHYNKVLRAGYALAPVAFMTEIKSPIKILARFANNIAYLVKLLGANEFLPQNIVLKWLSQHACEINHYEEAICENSLFVLCGHDPKQFNRTLLPIILSHSPAGASTKTLIHYAQIIRSGGRFQQYDYGSRENMIYYGTPAPPEYQLNLITLPIALLSAQNDWLSSEIDVSTLYSHLASPIENYVVPYKDFNHVDFLWAIDAPKLVYAKLLRLMEEGISVHSYYNPEMLEIDIDLS